MAFLALYITYLSNFIEGLSLQTLVVFLSSVQKSTMVTHISPKHKPVFLGGIMFRPYKTKPGTTETAIQPVNRQDLCIHNPSNREFFRFHDNPVSTRLRSLFFGVMTNKMLLVTYPTVQASPLQLWHMHSTVRLLSSYSGVFSIVEQP